MKHGLYLNMCYYRLILLIEVSKHLDRPLILLICAVLNCNWFVSAAASLLMLMLTMAGGKHSATMAATETAMRNGKKRENETECNGYKTGNLLITNRK